MTQTNTLSILVAIFHKSDAIFNDIAHQSFTSQLVAFLRLDKIFGSYIEVKHYENHRKKRI
jgi:hypothetical protein